MSNRSWTIAGEIESTDQDGVPTTIEVMTADYKSNCICVDLIKQYERTSIDLDSAQVDELVAALQQAQRQVK